MIFRLPHGAGNIAVLGHIEANLGIVIFLEKQPPLYTNFLARPENYLLRAPVVMVLVQIQSTQKGKMTNELVQIKNFDFEIDFLT